MRKRKQDQVKAVGEARAEWVIPRAPNPTVLAITRLSSKNQITIPAAMCRSLDIQPGDEIELIIQDNTIVLERLPRTPEEWLASVTGAMNVPEWSTKEKIDAWVRTERDSWDRDWDQDKPGS